MFQNCGSDNHIDPKDLSASSNQTNQAGGNSAVKIVASGAGRGWADGTFASSCLTYKNPSPPYVYDGSTGDGTYTIKLNGAATDVYCNMTLDGGGYTMIANVSPAPSGNWEYNVSTFGKTALPASLTDIALVTPANVNATTLAYSEVLFFDSGLNNWFVVDPASTFFTKNYPATCGAAGEINNTPFSVRASNGKTSVVAWFGNACPNTVDTITTGGLNCVDAFVNLDIFCHPATGTQIRAFVR